MIREFIIAEKKVWLNRNSNKIVVENSNHKKKKRNLNLNRIQKENK